MRPTNLFEETKFFLKIIRKSPRSVLFVESGTAQGTWEEFAELAKNINYDCESGSKEISDSLRIVGTDWFMCRTMYGNTESWSYVRISKQKEGAKRLTSKSLMYQSWRDGIEDLA